MVIEAAQTVIKPVDLVILRRFIPLQSLQEKHLKDLSQHARLIKVKPKTLLFKRGANLSERFYLVAGEIDLCSVDFKVKSVISEADNPYATALNSSNPTKSAAITTTASILLLINSDRLDLVLTWAQAGDYLVEDIQANEDEDKDNDEHDWMSDLLQSNLLQRIPPSHIQQLFMSFTRQSFRQGQQVIKQGDVGENFYVLQQGTAQVYRTDSTGETILATLTAGKFFGEEALISDNPRNASVRMLTDGACMKLDKATFSKLLHEPVIKKISTKAVKALQATDPKVQILDLRSLEEAQAEPLDNVMHIPLTELRQRMEELDKQLTYITHTINGRRAELGAYLLNDAGFEAQVMK